MEATTAKIVRRKKQAEVVVPEMIEAKKDIVKKIQARRNMFSLAERVAGDTYFHRNYYFEGSRDAFKEEPDLQTVDRFFPYADGGPLYVDEPMTEFDEDNCEIKKEYMRANKFRYLVIKRGMNELDCVEALI